MSRRSSGVTIPANLGGTDYLYEDLPVFGKVTLEDGVLAILPIIGALYLEGILPDLGNATLILYAMAAFVSFSMLQIKPQYMSLYEFLYKTYDFRKNKTGTYKTDRSQSLDELVQKNEGETDPRRKIQLKQVYPQYGVLSQQDSDTFVSIIEFEGKNLDMPGMDQSIQQNTGKFQEFLDNRLDSKMQFYLPKKQYDPSRQVETFQNRKNDRDVSDDELKVMYLEDRIQFHRGLAENGFYRRYYVIIKTERSEIISDQDYQKSWGAKIADADPTGTLGVLYYSFNAIEKQQITPDEVKYRQIIRSQKKAKQVSNNMQEFAGPSHILGGEEAITILKEFWNSETITKREAEGLLREKPYVSSDYAENDGQEQSRSQQIMEEKMESK